MYLCYMDESGTPDVPGNTSHYVLAGVSIPVQCWKKCDTIIAKIKAKYNLIGKEIHVAWLLRTYPEQNRIPKFELLSYPERIQQVKSFRNTELLRLQRSNVSLYRQTRKNYNKTDSYIHLTYKERRDFIQELAQTVSSWEYARIFAECVDKAFFDPVRAQKSIDEQSFEQVVSRFQQCLRIPKIFARRDNNLGLLIHDNNETVAKKHTLLMKKFHATGTLWTSLDNIIETPLFVNSELTGMVQIADLCAYSLRRYLENQEEALFNLVFKRADRNKDKVVGVRHFTNNSCACKICAVHRNT